MKTLLLLCSLTLAVSCWAQNSVSEPFNSGDIWRITHNIMPDDDWDKRNKSHQLDSTVSQAYDIQLEAWFPSEINKFIYYPSEGIESHFHETYQVYQEITEYKESGEIESMITKNWDGSQYVEDFKTMYYFGAQGNSRVDSLYTHVGGAWEISGYNEFIFDGNGNLLEQRGYQYVSGVAEPMFKYVFSLNAHGQVEEVNTYSFINSQWQSSYHYSFAYDAEDREVLFSYQEWLQNSWVNVFKLESHYSSENLLETNEYFWEPTGWMNRRNTFFEFDNTISSTKILLPIAYKANGHKITGKSSTVHYFGQWYPSDSVSFHYSGPMPNSAEELSQNQEFALLGNPVQERVQIENPNLKNVTVFVYDIAGKLKEQLITDSGIISISANNWTSGIYFATIMTENGAQVLRLVKE